MGDKRYLEALSKHVSASHGADLRKKYGPESQAEYQARKKAEYMEETDADGDVDVPPGLGGPTTISAGAKVPDPDFWERMAKKFGMR